MTGTVPRVARDKSRTEMDNSLKTEKGEEEVCEMWRKTIYSKTCKGKSEEEETRKRLWVKCGGGQGWSRNAASQNALTLAQPNPPPQS